MQTEDLSKLEIFPWDKNFETGIDLIDKQHKKLVEILNTLAAHLANRTHHIKLEEILDQLTRYADYHFASEEHIWRENFEGDEWLNKHEETHESFRVTVAALRENRSSKPIDDLIHEAVSFLTHWLAYHILDSDKRMASTVLFLQQGQDLARAKQHADEVMAGSMQVIIKTILNMYSQLSDRTLSLMRERSLRLEAEEALRNSEERWQFILETDVEGIWDWDMEKNVANFSEGFMGLLDFSGNSLENETLDRKKIHPNDISRVQKDFEDHISGKTPFFLNKHRILHKEGDWSWVLTRAKVISRDASGKPLRMIGTHADVTRRELATMIYDNTNEGIFVTDGNNNIISVNKAFEQITGYQQSQVIGKNPHLFSSGKHDQEFYQNLWSYILSEGAWCGEIWDKRANGQVYPAHMSITCIRDEQGNIDHYFAIFSDVTEKINAQEVLYDHAYKDSLTGLPNRRMCIQRLEQNILAANRSKRSFSVLFIDFDHFKEVNDSLGHDKGDELLIEAVKRIKTRLRDVDSLCRIGGDEFIVVIEEINLPHRVELVAQKIIDSINRPFVLDKDTVYLSCSIGITFYPDDAKDITDLLKYADQAMYLAKKSGRNCFRYFTPAMQADLEIRQSIKKDLHCALLNNELEVYYQPIINISTGEIEKAEALLRWFHPVRGMISPDVFIPIAEESGLIIEIGTWVYEQVIAQTSYWKNNGATDIKVSINNSPAQFRNDNKLASMINKLLEKYQLSGDRIVVEITEGLILECEEYVQKELIELRIMGVEVALDDFGTGYSSLSYLRQFDIDYIKIDRSFVSNIHDNSQDVILCEAMVAMAKKLNIKVIAEGIETQAQVEILSEMGCAYAQGYFYHKPMCANDMTRLFLKLDLDQ